MTQALTSEDSFQMRKSPVIAILVYTTLLPMVQSQSCSCGCCVPGISWGCYVCCWPCYSSPPPPPPPPPSGGSSSSCGAGCTNGIFYGCYCSSSSSGSSSSRFVVHLSHLSYLCGVAVVRREIYFWILLDLWVLLLQQLQVLLNVGIHFVCRTPVTVLLSNNS
jgi:hypothetical protein